MLMARNRAFTPFNPVRGATPIPVRLTASPAQEAAMRRQGVLPVPVEGFERHGADYPYPTPQVFQSRTDLDDSLAALLAGGLVTIGSFRMFRNTVGDKLRFWWETENPDSFDLLQFQFQVNGQAFMQQQFFTRPFVITMQPFFREIKSQAVVSLVAGLRAGAAPLPPLGSIEVQIFVDGYQAKFQ